MDGRRQEYPWKRTNFHGDVGNAISCVPEIYKKPDTCRLSRFPSQLSCSVVMRRGSRQMGRERHVLLNLFPPTSVCVFNPQTIFVHSFRCPTGNSLSVGSYQELNPEQQNSVVIRSEPLRGLATRNTTGYVDRMLDPYAARASARKLCCRSRLIRSVGLYCFSATCCLHIHFIVGGGSRFVRNVICYLQNYKTSLAVWRES
jgi:hypothetical protein